MAGLPWESVHSLSMAFKTPADFSGLHLYPFSTTPHTTSSSRPIAVSGAPRTISGRAGSTCQRGGWMYILLTCSSLLTLIPSDSTRAMGGQRPETPTPTPPPAGPWGLLQPPEAPKCKPPQQLSSTFTSWSSYSRETMLMGPALGKLPGWKSRNDPAHLGADRPRTKLGQDAGGY